MEGPQLVMLMQDTRRHENCFREVIRAHQRVVNRWRKKRPSALEELESITKKHTQDALYRPISLSEGVEEEFYVDVDEEMDGVRWPHSSSSLNWSHACEYSQRPPQF